MIVEERYTLFQIENKIRQIVQDGMDAMKQRMTKEAELVRKVQQQADAAKRAAEGMEPRIEKALSVRAALDKLRNEVTDIDCNVRVEAEKVQNNNEVIETNMTLLEGKVQGCIQSFNAEMSRVEEIRRTVKISNEQIADFKEHLSKRVDQQIEAYRMHVHQLEMPQREMQREFDQIKVQMAQLTEECNERKIQQDVADQRIEIALKHIKELQQDKLDKKNYRAEAIMRHN